MCLLYPGPAPPVCSTSEGVSHLHDLCDKATLDTVGSSSQFIMNLLFSLFSQNPIRFDYCYSGYLNLSNGNEQCNKDTPLLHTPSAHWYCRAPFTHFFSQYSHWCGFGVFSSSFPQQWHPESKRPQCVWPEIQFLVCLTKLPSMICSSFVGLKPAKLYFF